MPLQSFNLSFTFLLLLLRKRHPFFLGGGEGAELMYGFIVCMQNLLASLLCISAILMFGACFSKVPIIKFWTQKAVVYI